MSIVRVEKNTYKAEPLYQWDVNQVLQVFGLSLASVPEVHFTSAAMDRAIVRQAGMDSSGVISVNIPNSLLQKPCTITAYICLYTAGTFETQYKIDIPVKQRQQPYGYTLENDIEVYSFEALENTVKNALYVLDVYSTEFEKTIAATQKIADETKANKHASNHFSGGSDPITPADIGAAPYNANSVLSVDGFAKTVGGVELDWSRVQTGTYTGSGTYGKSNRNKLTFNFVPKLVIIQAVDADDPIHLMLVNPSTLAHGQLYHGFTKNTVAWSGKSVEWYCTARWVDGSGGTGSALYQMNESGKTYAHIAIG